MSISHNRARRERGRKDDVRNAAGLFAPYPARIGARPRSGLQTEYVQDDETHHDAIVGKGSKAVTFHKCQKSGDDDPGDQKGHHQADAERDEVVGAEHTASFPHLITGGDDERGKRQEKRIFGRDLPIEPDKQAADDR